jgi:hypothetical protein
MNYLDAIQRAEKIVRDFTALSLAHGYPPAQTCTLERWIVEALCDDAEQAALHHSNSLSSALRSPER